MRKIKITKIDSLFSNWIRERAQWTCERCMSSFVPPTSGLHCSHFIGRSNKATRFDPENCIALCYGCHSFFDGAGRMEFVEFMTKRLGKSTFKKLLKRGQSIMKESQAISNALVWLKK